MKRYLLFDAGCPACTGVARAIERESNGWLTARSLHDHEMRALLRKTRPEWRWEPTLLEVDSEHVRVFTGLHLYLRVISGLGLKRSWRIAGLVRQAHLMKMATNPHHSERRYFIKSAAAIFSGMLLLPGRTLRDLYQIPPELTDLNPLSPEEKAYFLSFIRNSGEYQLFASENQEFRFQLDDVFALGNASYILVIFVDKFPYVSTFVTLINRQSKVIEKTAGYVLNRLAQGFHSRFFLNGQWIVDGIQNDEGAFIQGYAFGSVVLNAQNRSLHGEMMFQNSMSMIRSIIGRSLERYATDSFVDCVLECLDRDMRIPREIVVALGIVCGFVCAFSGPVFCLECLLVAAGVYAWAVTVCAAQCGCGCR